MTQKFDPSTFCPGPQTKFVPPKNGLREVPAIGYVAADLGKGLEWHAVTCCLVGGDVSFGSIHKTKCGKAVRAPLETTKLALHADCSDCK
jgi:hypothetical protein